MTLAGATPDDVVAAEQQAVDLRVSDDEHQRVIKVMYEVLEQPASSPGAGHVSRYAARRIREALGADRMTQSRLAQRVGLDPMYLSRRLSGRNEFQLSEVVAIAAALDLDIKELVPRVVLPPRDDAPAAGPLDTQE